MSVSVIHLLEVVQIDEQNGELVAVACGTVDFGFQSLVKMPGIVEPGAIVRDGEFLNFFYRPGIFNGDGSVVANRLKKERFMVGEVIHIYINQLNQYQNP